ncbi:MAG: chemotaxis protein CheX [Spirochaetia bacterium]|nr:chemotaxis protein CheX [Spirochaetia bacterium]
MTKTDTEPFIQATFGVFENLFGVLPGAGAPSLETSPSLTAFDISGVIAISGALQGAVVVSFPRALLLKLFAKIDGNLLEEINEEMADMVGEIANMIAGNARRILENVEIAISTPTVLRKSEPPFVWPARETPVIRIPFALEEGFFDLSLNLK